MVAITVILAAVIATFVLGLGDQVSNTAPQASFSFDWNGASGGQDTLNITHDGGDTIAAKNLYIRGSWGSNSVNSGSINKPFTDSALRNPLGSSSQVKAGITVGLHEAGSDGEVSVVWERASGDNSATLSEWSGPDA
jgi:FlaG/FlaF family flagellin (archaellin)